MAEAFFIYAYDHVRTKHYTTTTHCNCDHHLSRKIWDQHFYGLVRGRVLLSHHKIIISSIDVFYLFFFFCSMFICLFIYFICLFKINLSLWIVLDHRVVDLMVIFITLNSC